MAIFSFTALVDGNVLSASDLNTPLSNAANATVPVANGGTGITTGTSGGVLAFTASGTLASSSALTQYGIVYGGGAGVAPSATAAGTTGQFLIATTGGAPSWSSTLAIEDSRTNTVTRPLTLTATTSGTPAASIGTGLLLRAESGDENPSDFGAIDAVATDVGAGTEDTDLVVSLRAAGAALAEKGRVTSDGGYKPGADAPATPVANVLYRDTIVKAWATWSNTPALTDDVNISSLTDNDSGGAGGDYTFNFATAMADTNFTCVATVAENPEYLAFVEVKATGSVDIHIHNTSGTHLDQGGNLVVLGGQ